MPPPPADHDAGDGDDCLERVRIDCATGEVCRENGCEPEQRPLQPGGCACEAGGPSGDPSPLLLLILRFALALRQRRRE